ncbi:MAG: hypothetical protein ACRDIY_20000 [Chloroflexota bacterium]
MLEKIARRDNEIWAGHSRIFEDATHVVGGAGIGLLMCQALSGRSREVGFALIGISAALHVYAFVTAQPTASVFGG